MNLKTLTTEKKNGTNRCRFVMLHHTAMGRDEDGAAAARYLSGPQGQGGMVSAHYVVGRNGTVWKIGNDNDRLWHAGDGDVAPFVGFDWNSYCIGIEIDSNGTDFTKAQFDATTVLVRSLMDKHKIDPDDVIRHADYSKRKWDVGGNFFKVGGCDGLQQYRTTFLTNNKMEEIDYKKIFDEEFPSGSTIFANSAALVNSIGKNEAYALLIGLERLKKYSDRNNTGV